MEGFALHKLHSAHEMLPDMHEYGSDLYEVTDLALEVEKDEEGELQCVWVETLSPRRREHGGQRYGATAWADGSWEVAVPRIAVNVPNRVARLKAIGNGQVSLCAAVAASALFEMTRQVEQAFADAERGPPEMTLDDLLG
jgi:hypothetical protein